MPCSTTGFPSTLVGDPVDTLTGAMTERKLEFRLIGPLELSWWRHYDSSQAGQRYALGWGHSHEFDRILFIGDERIIYGHPVGQQVWFPLLTEDGAEAAAQGYTIRRRSRSTYELHRHGEPSMEFVFAAGARRARPSRLYDDKGQILLHHDARNRLERIVHSTGAVLHATANEAGLLTTLTLEGEGGAQELLLSYSYDERFNLVGTLDGRGHGYAFAYDAANRMVQRRGRKGFRFRYRYDAEGRCIFSAGDDNWYGVALTYGAGGRSTVVRKPDGGIWTYKFLPGGRLSEIIDPLGGARKYLYDELGRATHEVDPLGNLTQYVLDVAGAPVRKVLPTGHVVPLPEPPDPPDPAAERVAVRPSEYQFGTLLPLPEGGAPSPSHVAALDIPREARVLATMRSGPDTVTAAQTVHEVKPLGAAWWPEPARGRVFNALGKLVEQRDDAGRTRHWTYDGSGNLEGYRDFDGGIWRYDFGRWHLLQSMTNPVGARTTLSYTTNEQVAACIDPGGTHSEYRYDLADHLVEVRRDGVVRETYTRDAAGNLVAKHAGDGRLLLTREIGPHNRLARRVLASGDDQTFVHDKSGRCILATAGCGAVARRYDATGRLAADQRDGRGLEFRLNGGGEPVDAVWFDRFTVRFDRSEERRLALVDPTGATHVVRWPGDGFMVVEFASGMRETSQFDDRGRCLFKDLRHADGRHWTRRYHWSGEGELFRIEDNSCGEIRHDYDAAHRLVGRRTVGRQETYVQDLADNLLAQPGLEDVVLGAGNRLASANGERLTYDDRGNLATRDGPGGRASYEYDSRGQLIGATTPEGVWSAAYDAFGRRVRKCWNGATTEFHWFGDQLVAETAPDGRLRLYVYADHLALTPLLLIDYESPEADAATGRVGAIISDQLGTPVQVHGMTGEALWQARITPFGTAEVAARSRIDLALRFPGHYADAELGLHYNRNRHYSPLLGRYLQSDPWGLYGGTNLYAYRTNPLLAADVRGLGEEGDHSKKKPPDDEEGAGPQKQPGGEPEGAGGQKALKDMSPDELNAHVEKRAGELKQAFKAADPEGEKRTTLSVGVVETGGDPETRRVVVSTSADDQRLPPAVKKAMQPGEAPIQGEPFFVRQPNPNHDPNKPTGPDNPKTRVHTVDMDKGTVNPQPYDKAKGGHPPEGTQHHAEQRMEMGAAERGEQVLAQQPTKPCCPGCTKVLGDSGKLDKVPNP